MASKEKLKSKLEEELLYRNSSNKRRQAIYNNRVKEILARDEELFERARKLSGGFSFKRDIKGIYKSETIHKDPEIASLQKHRNHIVYQLQNERDREKSMLELVTPGKSKEEELETALENINIFISEMIEFYDLVNNKSVSNMIEKLRDQSEKSFKKPWDYGNGVEREREYGVWIGKNEKGYAFPELGTPVLIDDKRPGMNMKFPDHLDLEGYGYTFKVDGITFKLLATIHTHPGHYGAPEHYPGGVNNGEHLRTSDDDRAPQSFGGSELDKYGPIIIVGANEPGKIDKPTSIYIHNGKGGESANWYYFFKKDGEFTYTKGTADIIKKVFLG